jgi:transcriptional regulator with XRE-family HTH domain
MAAKGWNQTRLSEEIGAASGLVSRWLRGPRRPSLEMALRLEKALGIPVGAWEKTSTASTAA